MKSSLDRAVGTFARVGVIALLSLGAVTAVCLATPALRTPVMKRLAARSGFAVNGRLRLAEPVFASSPRTVLLFASSSCAACEAAVPALAQVRAAVSPPELHTAFLLISTEGSTDGILQLGRQLGIERSQVRALAAPSELKLIPTLLVVDRAGTIRLSRQGIAPTAADKLSEDVLTALYSIPDR